jgi:hypothetical protein
MCKNEWQNLVRSSQILQWHAMRKITSVPISIEDYDCSQNIKSYMITLICAHRNISNDLILLAHDRISYCRKKYKLNQICLLQEGNHIYLAAPF